MSRLCVVCGRPLSSTRSRRCRKHAAQARNYARRAANIAQLDAARRQHSAIYRRTPIDADAVRWLIKQTGRSFRDIERSFGWGESVISHDLRAGAMALIRIHHLADLLRVPESHLLKEVADG